MKRIMTIIQLACASLFLYVPLASGAVDPFDSTVVRAILDSIGWKNIPVDSVAKRSTEGVSMNEVTVQRVTYLDLSHRAGVPEIERLPTIINRLSELVTLILNGNALEDLPVSLLSLTKLSRLYLSDNSFSELPKVLRLLSLYVLNADRNNLTELPEWMGEMKELQLASFIACRIITLPDSITENVNLTTLMLDSNLIETLPAEITGLEDLSISIDANGLCEVDSALLGWLNAHSLTPDWQAKQRCITTVSSVLTDASSGTVVHITSDVAPSERICQPIAIEPVDISSLSWFSRNIIKAVNLQYQECALEGQESFIITFTYGDVSDELEADIALAVYYSFDKKAQFVEGITIDTEKKTVSLRATRGGVYLLTANTTTGIRSRPEIPETVQLKTKVEGNRITLTSTTPVSQQVMVRILSLDGKIVCHSTLTFTTSVRSAVIHPALHLPSGVYGITVDGHSLRHRATIRLAQ